MEEFRQNRNSLLRQSMGGGCRNVNRKPTAVSRATPGVVTCLSASRVTKLLRLAWGHTSGCRRSRSADCDWKGISHCRIHSTMDWPHCQGGISPRYCSVRVSARSILRRSSRVSSTSTSGSISSASRMAEAKSTSGAPEALRTSSGGSSCISLPGMLTYSRSPVILGTTFCTYRRKTVNFVAHLVPQGGWRSFSRFSSASWNTVRTPTTSPIRISRPAFPVEFTHAFGYRGRRTRSSLNWNVLPQGSSTERPRSYKQAAERGLADFLQHVQRAPQQPSRVNALLPLYSGAARVGQNQRNPSRCFFRLPKCAV